MYSEIELDNATTTASELVNKAYSHTVTTINTTTDTFITDTDPFIYNTTSHYTSTRFMGVMIDTGASKHSIVGYSQFLAL